MVTESINSILATPEASSTKNQTGVSRRSFLKLLGAGSVAAVNTIAAPATPPSPTTNETIPPIQPNIMAVTSSHPSNPEFLAAMTPEQREKYDQKRSVLEGLVAGIGANIETVEFESWFGKMQMKALMIDYTSMANGISSSNELIMNDDEIRGTCLAATGRIGLMAKVIDTKEDEKKRGALSSILSDYSSLSDYTNTRRYMADNGWNVSQGRHIVPILLPENQLQLDCLDPTMKYIGKYVDMRHVPRGEDLSLLVSVQLGVWPLPTEPNVYGSKRIPYRIDEEIPNTQEPSHNPDPFNQQTHA